MDAEYAKKFRWPWEKFVNKSIENLVDASHTEDQLTKSQQQDDVRESMDTTRSNDPGTNELLSERFKPRVKRKAKNVKLSSQKFAYNKANGYIYSVESPHLALTCVDLDNNLSEIVLMKKNDDNVNQKWTYKAEQGLIVAKARSQLCLTVRLPALENLSIDLTDKQVLNKLNTNSIYNQATIVLQPIIDAVYGNAHQRWYIDEHIGFIYAFASSNEKNVEIMAANKANLCSYYVTNEEELAQPVISPTHPPRTPLPPLL